MTHIPAIGFGTYKLDKNICSSLVKTSVDCGYTLIDTAELYKNEQCVKKVIDEKVMVMTKISHMSIKKGNIKSSFYERLSIFGKIDILLLHCPSFNCKKDWQELCELYKVNKNRIKFIGVSNYKIKHLEQISDCLIQPFCNQIELSPFLTRTKLVNYLIKKNIKIIAHSSLVKGRKFDNKTLISLSKKYSKSPAQILLRWGVDKGYTVLPRSNKYNKIKENINIFDFCLENDDINILDALNENYATHPLDKYK